MQKHLKHGNSTMLCILYLQEVCVKHSMQKHLRRGNSTMLFILYLQEVYEEQQSMMFALLGLRILQILILVCVMQLRRDCRYE